MRYQIIARRMSPSHSDDYRHVVEVQYRGGAGRAGGRRPPRGDPRGGGGPPRRPPPGPPPPPEQMVNRLGRGDTAYIAGDDHHSEVGVFDLFRSRALRRAKYLRSYGHDDHWNDSLLQLPAF